MATCENCGAAIEAGEEYEHLGRTLCEDCYLDAMNPPKACDPWAVHTARSAGTQQLTELQDSILSLLKEQGALTADELTERLGISETEFRRAFATLRHMELARGFKEGDRVYYTTFS
jgi:transcriptional regulator GlxA family with amidase domain